ncbi:hypothetical protein JW916_10425 [Candidatus Sumerlaeota bacterium]|nr:hypothetical protein [Candidatus Sumerlaeota bacterium]
MEKQDAGALREIYSGWPTENLVRTLLLERDDYRPDAVEAMENELAHRSVAQSEREALLRGKIGEALRAFCESQTTYDLLRLSSSARKVLWPEATEIISEQIESRGLSIEAQGALLAGEMIQNGEYSAEILPCRNCRTRMHFGVYDDVKKKWCQAAESGEDRITYSKKNLSCVCRRSYWEIPESEWPPLPLWCFVCDTRYSQVSVEKNPDESPLPVCPRCETPLERVALRDTPNLEAILLLALMGALCWLGWEFADVHAWTGGPEKNSPQTTTQILAFTVFAASALVLGGYAIMLFSGKLFLGWGGLDLFYRQIPATYPPGRSIRVFSWRRFLKESAKSFAVVLAGLACLALYATLTRFVGD